jgi:hypothetical protein
VAKRGSVMFVERAEEGMPGAVPVSYPSGVTIPVIAPNSGAALRVLNALNAGVTLNVKSVTVGTLGREVGPRKPEEIDWWCEPIVFTP